MNGNVKTLFLAWKDPKSRCWHPIGRLTLDGIHYQFLYVRGAKDAQEKCNFQPLTSFPDIDKVYESDELPPLFKNRVLSPSRPEYKDFAKWLCIPEDKNDPIAILSRSGGRRATDTLEVFPLPQCDEFGGYHIHFFAHGLSHLPPESQERINKLEPGENLLLVCDTENQHDPNARMLQTNDGYKVGYCPRYLLDDISEIEQNCSETPGVSVERINPPPTPLAFRLLCSMTACWPENFTPLSGMKYKPIVENITT